MIVKLGNYNEVGELLEGIDAKELLGHIIYLDMELEPQNGCAYSQFPGWEQ